MSDVDDWSGISAGATQLVKSGVAQLVFDGIRFVANLGVTGIPASTRSLLVMAYVTATQFGATGQFSMQVTGNVTGLRWFSQNQVLNDSGSAIIGPNQAIAPQYVPFYGQVDTQAAVSISANITATVDYWILALPDADILGSAFTPMVVGNSWVQALSTANGQALAIEPATGAVFTVAQSVSPLPIARGRLGSQEVTVALAATGPHNFIAAPAAGLVRIVDFLLFSGGTSITIGVNGGANILPITVGTSLVGPGFVLAPAAGGLTFNNTATGGNAYASFHDEAA